MKGNEMITSSQAEREPPTIDWEAAHRYVHDGDNHIVAVVDYRLEGKHIGKRQIVRVTEAEARQIINARKGLPTEYWNILLKKYVYQ